MHRKQQAEMVSDGVENSHGNVNNNVNNSVNDKINNNVNNSIDANVDVNIHVNIIVLAGCLQENARLEYDTDGGGLLSMQLAWAVSPGSMERRRLRKKRCANKNPGLEKAGNDSTYSVSSAWQGMYEQLFDRIKVVVIGDSVEAMQHDLQAGNMLLIRGRLQREGRMHEWHDQERQFIIVCESEGVQLLERTA